MHRIRFVPVVAAACCMAASIARGGNVTAVVKHGSLVLSGSATVDRIFLSQVDPANPHRIRVEPGVATTLNGLGTPQSFSGVTRDVRASLGDGDDVFDLSSGALPRGLVLHCGSSGSPSLSIFGTVKGNVRVDTEGAALDVSISNGIVGGDFRVVGGPQADFVNLISHSLIGGDLTLRMNGGADHFNLSQSTFAGRTTLSGGPGANTYSLSGSTFGGRVLVAGGAEAEMLHAPDSFFRGSVRFSLGESDAVMGNVVESLRSSFARDVRISGGSGRDSCSFDQSEALRRVRFDGGAGPNSFASDFGSAESFDLRGGGGVDSISMGGSIVATRDLLIRSGAGDNVVIVSSAMVGNAFTVRAGAGDDTLTVTNVQVLGKERFDLGGGTNSGP